MLGCGWVVVDMANPARPIGCVAVVLHLKFIVHIESKLCSGTFFLFNGIMLVSAFGSYITIFYVCGGDQDLGAKFMGFFGTDLP